MLAQERVSKRSMQAFIGHGISHMKSPKLIGTNGRWQNVYAVIMYWHLCCFAFSLCKVCHECKRKALLLDENIQSLMACPRERRRKTSLCNAASHWVQYQRYWRRKTTCSKLHDVPESDNDLDEEPQPAAADVLAAINILRRYASTLDTQENGCGSHPCLQMLCAANTAGDGPDETCRLLCVVVNSIGRMTKFRCSKYVTLAYFWYTFMTVAVSSSNELLYVTKECSIIYVFVIEKYSCTLSWQMYLDMCFWNVTMV